MVDQADYNDNDKSDELVASDRDQELSKNKKVRDQLLDIFKDVEKGFEDQYERSNCIMDFWNIYNTELGSKQFYSGNN